MSIERVELPRVQFTIKTALQNGGKDWLKEKWSVEGGEGWVCTAMVGAGG